MAEEGHEPNRVFLDQDGNFNLNDAKFLNNDDADIATQLSGLDKMAIIPTATVAAAGSGQGDAAPVTTGFTFVTGADATKAVVLPTAVAGLVCILKNDDAANAVLPVFPASSDAINALAADASLDLAAKTSVFLVALDAVTWYSLPLLPS